MARKSSSTNQIIMVSGNPSEIRKALRLQKCVDKLGGMDRIKAAIRFYDMSHRFFETGGRFKKPFSRKKKVVKKAAKKKSK